MTASSFLILTIVEFNSVHWPHREQTARRWEGWIVKGLAADSLISIVKKYIHMHWKRCTAETYFRGPSSHGVFQRPPQMLDNFESSSCEDEMIAFPEEECPRKKMRRCLSVTTVLWQVPGECLLRTAEAARPLARRRQLQTVCVERCVFSE